MAINESMNLSEIFATYDSAKKNLAQNVEAVKNSGQKIAAIFCTYTPREIIHAANAYSVSVSAQLAITPWLRAKSTCLKTSARS